MQGQFNSLCNPAKLYLTLSAVSFVLMVIQNLSDSKKFCLGVYSCDLSFPNVFIFLVKLGYVLFWTIVLDSLCKNGYEDLSWVIVLLPFVLFFLLLALLLVGQK